MIRTLKVLIACEESQVVCSAFRSLGHFAYSCDLLPTSGLHPEWHFQCDVLSILDFDWDLIIAHPPCTFLTKAGATRMFPVPGVCDPSRFQAALLAKDFFLKFLLCSCKYVAVENPTPLHIVVLPAPDQVINPFDFGDPYSKRTCLWLKNLPPLFHTLFCPDYSSWVSTGTTKGVAFSSRLRSRSFAGIASAMAHQWSEYILLNDDRFR